MLYPPPLEIRQPFTKKLIALDRRLHKNASTREWNGWEHYACKLWAYVDGQATPDNSGEREDPRRIVFWQGYRKLGGLKLSGALVISQPLTDKPAAEALEQSALTTSFVYGANYRNPNSTTFMVYKQAVDRLGDLSARANIEAMKQGVARDYKIGIMQADTGQCMDFLAEMQRGGTPEQSG